MTGDAELALDAVQAGMLLIARRLTTLRDPRWFRAWAYRIVTREAVRLARRRGRERLLFDEDARVEAVEVPATDHAIDPAICAGSIDRLPTAARLVLGLHYLEGLTLVEIAEALEVPLGTVKSRLAYGLARLRALLAET